MHMAGSNHAVCRMVASQLPDSAYERPQQLELLQGVVGPHEVQVTMYPDAKHR